MRDLSRLEGRNFLVVGRAGMDFYADPPGTRTEVAGRFVACIGGSSANIAVALVKQGCKAALLTRVSDDAVGRFCLNELDRYGVDRSHVVFAGGEARTSLSVVETRLEDCQSVIYRNGAADFALTIDDVEAVDYGRFAAMIVTGTALAAEPSRGAVFRSIDVARRAGLPVILDIDYRPYSWASNADAAEVCGQAARLSDVIVGNDVEFGVLAGDARRGLDRARELVDGGAAIVVYKMGERGAVDADLGPRDPYRDLSNRGAEADRSRRRLHGGLRGGIVRGMRRRGGRPSRFGISRDRRVARRLRARDAHHGRARGVHFGA